MTTSFHQDPPGSQKSVVTNHCTSPNYSYTSAGRLSGAAWSTGLSEAYSYNTVGELTSVTPSGIGNMGAVQYGYDPSGRVSTVTRNGVFTPTTTAVSYDAAGQVTSLEHAPGATVVDGYAITRDVRGNPTEVTTTTPGGSSSALYGYDWADQLLTKSVAGVATVTNTRSLNGALATSM